MFAQCCCNNGDGGNAVEKLPPAFNEALPALPVARQASKEREARLSTSAKAQGQDCQVLPTMSQEPGATDCKDANKVECAVTPEPAPEASSAAPITIQELKKEALPNKETCEFTVIFRKNTPSEPLGLALTREDNGGELVIKDATGPAVSTWNMMYPGLALRPADQIVSVNGVTGSADDLLRALQTPADSVQLVIKRILLLNVAMQKSGALGIGLDAETMEVQRIAPGMLADYNNHAPPSKEILVGDKVIEVNGQTGASEELLGAMRNCKDGETVTILFNRPEAVEL